MIVFFRINDLFYTSSTNNDERGYLKFTIVARVVRGTVRETVTLRNVALYYLPYYI